MLFTIAPHVELDLYFASAERLVAVDPVLKAPEVPMERAASTAREHLS